MNLKDKKPTCIKDKGAIDRWERDMNRVLKGAGEESHIEGYWR